MKIIPRKLIEKWYAEEYSKPSNKSVYGKPTRHMLHFFDLLSKHKFKDILEIGCGDGRNLIELARRGFNVTGIDLFGGEAFKFQANKFNLNVNFIRQDITKYNFTNKKYDVVICSEVIHLIEKIFLNEIINKIKKATKANGLIYINILTNLKRVFLKSKEEFKYENQADYYSGEIKRTLNQKFNDWKIIGQGIYHEEQDWPVKLCDYPIGPYHWSGDYVYIIAQKIN